MVIFICPRNYTDEQLVEAVSKIDNLEKLYCIDCLLLTSIPLIKGLKCLECWDCPLLTSIPFIEGLTELDCSNCISLKFIPRIKGLKYLDYSNLDYSNCPLVEYTSRKFNEWFYAPDVIGGRTHKKNILKSLEKIN